MKDYYVEKADDIDFFLNSKSLPIMSKELVLLELSSDMAPKTISTILKKTKEFTSNVCLKTDGERLLRENLLDLLRENSIDKICLKDQLRFPLQEILPCLYRDTDHYLKSQTAISLMGYHDRLKTQFDLSVELSLEENKLQLLFPTIMALSKMKFAMIILDPQDIPFHPCSQIIKNQLNLLRIYLPSLAMVPKIHFSFEHPDRDKWESKTENLFGGPNQIDIDVSNLCTHNCIFCGLYAKPNIQRQKMQNHGALSAETKKIYRAQIERNDCLKLIDSLPETTRMITFGGAGDPFTHPNIGEFIRRSRERNLNITTYTNFSYMTEDLLRELHSYCCDDLLNLWCIVNISGPDPSTYIKTRPNQKEKTFHQVIKHLKFAFQLFKQDGRGITFTLMCVSNKYNYHSLPYYVGLAKETAAMNLWIKPLEIHGKETLNLLIPSEEFLEYAQALRLCLYFADKLDVDFIEREIIEKVVDQYRDQLQEYDQKHSFALQVKEALRGSALLSDYYFKIKDGPKIQNLLKKHPPFFQQKKWKGIHNQKREKANKKILQSPSCRQYSPTIDLQVKNGGHAAELYDQIPCYIGHQYLRIEVLGNVTPCCISNYPIANIKNKSLNSIWFSDSMNAFREKLKKINSEKFHRQDPEWLFCQQCPHMDINIRFNNY